MAALKQAELGLPGADLIRQVGISEQTFYTLEEAVRGSRVGPSAGAQTGVEEDARLKRRALNIVD